MSQESITARTARGASWLLSWRVVTRLIGLLSTLVLARLLSPADFGVVALGTAMLAAVDALSSLGVGDQLVREDDPDRAMYDTAFTLTLVRGVVLGLAMCLASRSLARFFGDERLQPVVIALAASLIIGSFENIAVVQYRRDLNFKKDFLLAAIPRTISQILVIASAFMLRDYRALIVGLITGRLLSTTLSYPLQPYRPRLTLRSWRALTSFSLWTWASGLVTFFRNRSDSIVIARLIGPTMLGIYSVGQEIASLPFSELVWPIAGVLFPSFAAVRQSGLEISSAYSRALGGVFLLVLPATVGTAFVAEPVTALLFGEKWLAAVPLIRLLSLGGTLMICSAIGRSLLNSYGLPRINFQILLASTIVRVPAIVILTMKYGMIGSAVGVLSGTVLEEALFLAATLRLCQIRLGAVLSQVWRPAAAAALMAATLGACAEIWVPGTHQKLELVRSIGLAVSIGAVSYVGSLVVLWLAAGRPRSAEVEIAHYGSRILSSAFHETRRRLVPAFGGMR